MQEVKAKIESKHQQRRHVWRGLAFLMFMAPAQVLPAARLSWTEAPPNAIISVQLFSIVLRSNPAGDKVCSLAKANRDVHKPTTGAGSKKIEDHQDSTVQDCTNIIFEA